MNNDLETRCLYCSKLFFKSREDRLFCNDSCRNTYNRLNRFDVDAEKKRNISIIIKTLKSNYKILAKSYYKNSRQYEYMEDLFNRGMNFSFFTGTFQDDQGLWKCCFDIAWLEFEPGECLLMEIPEQRLFQDDFLSTR